jgi:hypothetical protein
MHKARDNDLATLTLFYRGSLADIRRCLSSSRINIAVVSAEREYLCLINLVLHKAIGSTYQVATYDACELRMSTMGTLPTGTPFCKRMATSPA